MRAKISWRGRPMVGRVLRTDREGLKAGRVGSRCRSATGASRATLGSESRGAIGRKRSRAPGSERAAEPARLVQPFAAWQLRSRSAKLAVAKLHGKEFAQI